MAPTAAVGIGEKPPGRVTIFQKKLKETSYSFFRKELREAMYDLGDIYSNQKVAESQEEWNIGSNQPYLRHIKNLSPTWPHLRLLADFMEVSTTPLRWLRLNKKEHKAREEREKRAKKTNVTRLDYLESGVVVPTNFATVEKLRDALGISEKEKEGKRSRRAGAWMRDPTEVMQDVTTGAWSASLRGEEVDYDLRLYVVEDLSRDMIEALGEKFDVEPAFFREQIVDYTWSNIRDRWWDPPSLKMAPKGQQWLPLRFVTARYFKSAEKFLQGCNEADEFNVLRVLNDDLNNKSVWDDDKAIVGISRAKASLWMRGAKKGSRKGALGILLLDPTIKAGTPLWYGYRNWEPTPSYKTSTIPAPPIRTSFFHDFLHWAQKPDALSSQLSGSATSNVHLPITILMRLICGEWLTMAEYIKTRLNQIEWEISVPEHFLRPGTEINDALSKLHVWRRLVPLYTEMLDETVERLSQVPWWRNSNSPTNKESGDANPSIGTAFAADLHSALNSMQKFQAQIDRLTSVVTAMVSIDDSRNAASDNRNLQRLTWLGTLFIPLSYISSLLSMQSDVGIMAATFRLYFAVALPSAAAAVGLLLVLPVLQGWWGGEMGEMEEKRKMGKGRYTRSGK